jgi:hypothetical protein
MMSPFSQPIAYVYLKSHANFILIYKQTLIQRASQLIHQAPIGIYFVKTIFQALQSILCA